MKKQEVETIELANGIRLVHKENPYTKIAHIGIMLDIGSRDELPSEQGLAHFWEHMAFKGTEKRKAYHIINRLESLGGELNAYTTKEKICFYSSLLSAHVDKAVELLADITFNSTFPERQIQKERQVILEEMAMYKDTPEDSIQDDFDEVVFDGHSLGKNIIGTEKTVASFKKDDFRTFIDRNLDTGKIVISSVGNYPIKKIERIVRKYMESIPPLSTDRTRTKFEVYKPSHSTETKDLMQVHYGLGLPIYHLKHPSRIPFFLLCNILGGPALNSRLNLSLRENNGLVYGIEASYSPYIDTGLFSIFFATDPRNLRKSKQLIAKEMRLLKTKPLGKIQLHNAKQQVKGQLAMSEENYNAMMLMMAKSTLDLETVPEIDDIFKKIDAVTAEDLQEIANEAFDLDQMSTILYTPEKS
jgi:predicted Zn-dependent peptidase